MPHNFPILVGAGTPVPTTGDYEVRTIDPILGVVNTQYVNKGVNATPYTHPTHDYLTADGYNNSYDNIQHDMDIGLQYKTTSGDTLLFLSITNITGKKPTIYLNKANTALMTVDWGDGETTTSSASGHVALAKPNDYAVGDYIVSINCAGNYNFYTYLFNNNANYNSCLTRCYLGNTVTSFGGSVFRYTNLMYLIISTSVTHLYDYAIYLDFLLKYLIIPSSVVQLYIVGIRACREISINMNVATIIFNLSSHGWLIRKVILPPTYTTIAAQTFYDASSISKIEGHKNCTSIGTYAFVRNYAFTEFTIYDKMLTIDANAFYGTHYLIKLVVLPTIPPSLGSGNFGTNKICKMYVPDAQITDYQDATNWITFANYFYPLSELPEYDGSIFFHSNGGSVVEHIQGTPGELAELPPDPTKPGLTFYKWYKDADLIDEWNWATGVYPATNITLYAKWV
jgi:uncharacterized repeat protein (TIGR02543 family)